MARIPRQRTNSVNSKGFGVWNGSSPGNYRPSSGGGGSKNSGCGIVALLLVSIPAALASAGGWSLWHLLT